MNYIVSITSQGQFTIPSKLRWELGLNKRSRAFVNAEKGKLIVEPVKDLLELKGVFKTKIKASPSQVRESFGEYLAKQAAR